MKTMVEFVYCDYAFELKARIHAAIEHFLTMLVIFGLSGIVFIEYCLLTKKEENGK